MSDERNVFFLTPILEILKCYLIRSVILNEMVEFDQDWMKNEEMTPSDSKFSPSKRGPIWSFTKMSEFFLFLVLSISKLTVVRRLTLPTRIYTQK